MALEYIFSCASALGAFFIPLGKRFMSIPTTFLFSCQSKFTSLPTAPDQTFLHQSWNLCQIGERLKEAAVGYAAFLFLQSVAAEFHSLVRQIFEKYLL